MSQSTLVWKEIDPSTMTPDLVKAYQAYKASYAAAKAMRTAFEEAASKAAGLPAGKALVFGYNFGKLSMAVGEPKKAKGVGSRAASFSALTA